MENFQKVVFVPTWYVQVGSTYYSIDQLETGEIHEAIYSQEAN